MKVCVLGSSSAANATYISDGSTSLLIDAGFTCKKIRDRLKRIDVELESIDAICVTHEHSDHVAGLPVLSRTISAGIYANSGTADALAHNSRYAGVNWTVFATGSPFQIGTLSIEPFRVPHDAYEPVGFVVDDGQQRVGVVTDMGISTTLIRDKLASCQVAVLESNYDTELLKNSERPWHLKQRIMGRQGHLSNDQGSELIAEIIHPDLRRVYLAHLSSDCNLPSLAKGAAAKVLKKAGASHVELELTSPDEVSALWDL